MSIRGLIDSVTGAEITDMDVAKTQIGVGNVSELSMTFSVSESAPSPVSGKVILYLSS